MDTGKIVFIDAEIDPAKKRVSEAGAVKGDGGEFRSKSLSDFALFLRGAEYVCGHNIFMHDLKYLEQEIAASGAKYFIDTLPLSPLLFPKKPYHKLLKDDKITADELNNPLNDAKKARDLFYDEVAAFANMDKNMQAIYHGLLSGIAQFQNFFRFAGYQSPQENTAELIRETFAGKICGKAPVGRLAEKYPAELSFALSQISVMGHDSITPPWVLKNYPRMENIMHFLRNTKNPVCEPACAYCAEFLDETAALKRFFNYDDFRSYGGLPLQKQAVRAALQDKSILAVFPTGGGKSITFQVPALMAGLNEKGLTVIISPLQALMKDQCDTLEKQHNITDATAINGSLDPLERAKAFEMVEDGSASILYISPESLRSNTIERLLVKRNIARFVIDEAHCFSSWGQDFRVDYLYIGDFIASLQKKKNRHTNIPVSCFTATAKQQVIADIKSYFKAKLGIELELFTSNAQRTNLSYHIFNEDRDSEKYLKLRHLIEGNECQTIVYVSRTRRAEQLAEKLNADGYPAKPYHGQMDRQLRILNQDAFMQGDVKIIVATTAFGMGVDKKDIEMVIHYDISDSLENYVQEAGRAGRDEKLNANCYILFNDDDLNSHFHMLNQTKLLQKEIQQVWKAIKGLTKQRASISQSALELAKEAGWDDSVRDVETRVKAALNALEQSGFVKRGQNQPTVFADAILARNMGEARERIDKSARFDDRSKEQALRIMSRLFSAKSKIRGEAEAGEARVDYIADILGIEKQDVINVIGLLREEKILADAKDLVAYIKSGQKSNQPKNVLLRHRDIENFLIEHIGGNEGIYNVKEMNEKCQREFPGANINQIYALLNYYSIAKLVKKTKRAGKDSVALKPYFAKDEMQEKSKKRHEIAESIVDFLHERAAALAAPASEPQDKEDALVDFSVLELKNRFEHNLFGEKAGKDEIEDALYYLSKIGVLKIEGGFLVIYNKLRIDRVEKDGKINFKKEHYAQLEEYYRNKRQQIHIVGEYASRMINDYSQAMTFVNDYFTMDYDKFLQTYFKGKNDEINKNITPKKFKQLFGELSPAQLQIINNHDSNCIVVAAGPGSGKTKLLVHKLASLCMTEDVKHEQMLMLTFSRAAASEFKKRLAVLIGGAANFIKIMTFHSYCFDLLGKIGDSNKLEGIIEHTLEKIKTGEVDPSKLTMSVLVIDEAQDVSEPEYLIVKILMERNEGLRVIAVGDDDQNIYQFRGSDSKYFASLLEVPAAEKYELLDNYRSCANLVDFSNNFAQGISNRLKTIPIMAHKKNIGTIDICKTASENIAIPAVEIAVKAALKVKSQGTACIITRTNEDALDIVTLLLQKGVPAKQIQTNNDFNLYNLDEIRYFIGDIEKNNSSPVVAGELWQKAKSRLCEKYKASGDLPDVLELVKNFEELNPRAIYITDFKQFVRESKLEDFFSTRQNLLFVSTMHQAKGREFDHVFLALGSLYKHDDEQTKRAVYVAITRAKQSLHIICNGDYFDAVNAENIARTFDGEPYPRPSRIKIQLTHKDVALGYFAYQKKHLERIVSGAELSASDAGCFYNGRQVLKFSAGFCRKINDLKAKGYSPVKAAARHLVFWKGEDMENEIKILLPDVEFSKENS
ncbi:MAG: RecQ family ATP-dependent DNA helicase [Spirochaetes bacterium]|nr:RecQ family ATP-dependent DNA helicase [Spirochaetota bacterium]